MGRFISRQPNGKLCIFSSVVDCPTAWDLTDDEYIELRMEEARKKALETLTSDLKDFNEVIGYFLPNNMTQKQFNGILYKMGYEKKEQ